jgi:hypothetical protein
MENVCFEPSTAALIAENDKAMEEEEEEPQEEDEDDR